MSAILTMANIDSGAFSGGGGGGGMVEVVEEQV